MARLLAVDDNSDSAELIVRVASKCGYEARPMTDLRPLRSVLEEWKPHVLTLDLVMPQEDGIAILSTSKGLMTDRAARKAKGLLDNP